MQLKDIRPGLVGIASSFGASLCCVLPLVIVLAGLGSGAFMMVTMQLRWVLYPLGLLGLGVSWFLFFRERRRCQQLACQMVGRRTNLALVLFSTGMMVLVTYVDFFLVSM